MHHSLSLIFFWLGTSTTIVMSNFLDLSVSGCDSLFLFAFIMDRVTDDGTKEYDQDLGFIFFFI